MSKIVVDTIESSGTTVTVSDNLDAGTNAVTAGSVTGLTATSLTSGTLAAARLPATGVDASSLTTGALPNARLAAGAVLQVVTAELTTIQSSTTLGWHDLTGFPTVSITPSSTDSKILIIWAANMSSYNGSTPTVRIVRDQPSSDTVTTVNTQPGYGSLSRGIAVAPGYNLSSSTEASFSQSASFLDSPSTTSATVYKAQWYGRTDGSGHVYTINTFYAWGDQVYYGAGISSITLMEIQG